MVPPTVGPVVAGDVAYGFRGFVEPNDRSCCHGHDLVEPDGRLTGGVQEACGLVYAGADTAHLAAGIHQLKQDGAPRCAGGGLGAGRLARAASAAYPLGVRPASRAAAPIAANSDSV
jgi:hypothetical protein